MAAEAVVAKLVFLNVENKNSMPPKFTPKFHHKMCISLTQVVHYSF